MWWNIQQGSTGVLRVGVGQGVDPGAERVLDIMLTGKPSAWTVRDVSRISMLVMCPLRWWNGL